MSAPSLDILLHPQTPSASALAEALGGRWAAGPDGYYLTPARARKWHALNAAGFSAVRHRTFGQWVWSFTDGTGARMALHQAVKAANEVNAGAAVAVEV